jgi:hypothetical protein
MENATLFSNHSSGSIRPELKSGSVAPTEGHHNEDSLSDVRGVKWQNSDKKMEAFKRLKSVPRGNQNFCSMVPFCHLLLYVVSFWICYYCLGSYGGHIIL